MFICTLGGRDSGRIYGAVPLSPSLGPRYPTMPDLNTEHPPAPAERRLRPLSIALASGLFAFVLAVVSLQIMLSILSTEVSNALHTMTGRADGGLEGGYFSRALSPMLNIVQSKTEIAKTGDDACIDWIARWLDGNASLQHGAASEALANGVCGGATIVVSPRDDDGAFTILRTVRGDQTARVEATTFRQTSLGAFPFLLSNPAMMALAVGITFSGGLFGYFLRLSQYRAYVNIRHQAFTDELSGALRREQFLANVRQTIDRVHEMGGTVSLLAIDLDHFKSINDSFGHAAGDEVIRSCGRLLSAAVRDGDIVGRVGGEEFAILLPNLPKYIAAEVADRLRKQMASHAFCFDGHDLFVTMSTGVASLMGADSIEALMDRADRRLYLAKARGRNCVVWEDDDNHDY